MNRETIVKHVKAKDRVIVWTATNLYSRYWLYGPRTNRVDYVVLTDVPETIKLAAKQERRQGGVWVHGLAGISALFPVVRCSDDVAEQMLLATLPKIDLLSEPLITMTAEEEKEAQEVLVDHFEEDRNELRGIPRT